MDAAHTEAVVFAVFAAFFLTVAGLALRLRLRTGQRNPWLWAGLFGGVLGIALVVLNLSGVVVGGVAGSDTHTEHGLAPLRTTQVTATTTMPR
jgi:hypothetical protein